MKPVTGLMGIELTVEEIKEVLEWYEAMINEGLVHGENHKIYTDLMQMIKDGK